MSKVLYRVTSQNHKIDEIIIANEDSNNFINSHKRGLGWIESILEKHKPSNVPSRRISFFGFDNLNFCGAYAQPEKIDSPKYYKISVKEYWKAPMILVNQLNVVGENSTILQKIAYEYWNYREEWNLIEYLFTQAKVLEIITPPTNEFISGAKFLYMQDLDKAKKLFP